MIPSFEPTTGNLPPGVHEATWEEFVERFSFNWRRRALLGGLKSALLSLRSAGCLRVFIGGSFVTAKELPADFDACWEAAGVDPGLLDPVLWISATVAPHRRRSIAESFSQRTWRLTRMAGCSWSLSDR